MTSNSFLLQILEDISLGLGDADREFIKDKHLKLREQLRVYLPLEDDFLTGSYARSTILKPKGMSDKFDVDIFIAFNSTDYQASELEDLRALVIQKLHAIKTEHPELGLTGIEELQRRSVGVLFGKNFQIDVVPSLQIEKDKLYKIYDRRTLEAVYSNPKLHTIMVQEINQRENAFQLFVPLVRLIKFWKRKNASYMKSFHLELLATKIFTERGIGSYSDGLQHFFAAAEPYFTTPSVHDPANPGGEPVDSYLDRDKTRENAKMAVHHAKNLASEAKALEDAASEDRAVEKWKELFFGTIKQAASHQPPRVVIQNPPSPWQTNAH